jgi:tetratricopeptide (TPR) repeat protein
VLPDNVASPFEPAPDAPESQQDDQDAAPPAPQQSDRILNPDAAARAMRLPQRATAGNGPSKRLEVVLTDRLSDPDVLRAISRSYAERGEWDAAAAVLRAAVERSPLNHDLQFELGIAEARSGDYVASLMHLQQCGDLAVAHYNLGVLLHEAGLLDASILAFRSALRYDPDLNQARVWLSELAPQQAAAAGRRPSMIGAPAVAPVKPPAVERAEDGSGIEIRPASGRRMVKRSPLGATELGSKQPAARE